MAKLQKKCIADRDRLAEILKRFWGFESFRPLQEEIICSVLEGNDTLALMPTGGGKSLTFQVPGMAMEGICLVVTPLISLMRDQVDQLVRRNIKATAIHSGMTREEISVALDNCIYGEVKFLYVSPERLGTDLFIARVRQMNVCLVAVDEAHCISQWGYDFRPSYLEISRLREILEEVPLLALTATATPEVCEDIQSQLRFRRKNLLSVSFDRPNLAYVVRRTENKERELVEIAEKLKGSGIVYVRSRKKCREYAGVLHKHGITAGYYHAGLKPAERDERQREWSDNRFRVMVATNAFGMGIDKSDVRFVVHPDLPDTPEAYFQEAGRAGRDGERSWAILLYSPVDEQVARRRIETGFPGIPKVRQVYTALCNYLQIPVGSGKGRQFDFDLADFLSRYRFPPLLASSCLTLLAREGYISLSDAFHNPSRIMFLTGRDELYSFQVKNEEYDSFIKLLLRSYTGLFSGFVRIDEATLAKRSGLSAGRVKEYLATLSSRHVIRYIPRKRVPVVTFLEERLDEKNLLIDPGRYRFRKERFEKRTGEMIRYASSVRHCRNQFLLGYFGELNTSRCGRCDVCLGRQVPEPGTPEFDAVRKELLSMVPGEGILLETLVRRSRFTAPEALAVVEYLLDERQLVRGSDLKIRIARS